MLYPKQGRPEGGSPPSKMGGPGPRGARKGPLDRRKKKKKIRRKKKKKKRKKKRKRKEKEKKEKEAK